MAGLGQGRSAAERRRRRGHRRRSPTWCPTASMAPMAGPGRVARSPVPGCLHLAGDSLFATVGLKTESNV